MRKLASPWTRTLQAISILLLAGCSTYRPWINEPYPHQPREVLAAEQHQPKSVMVAVTLSGGGARAAAFGLGVLRELKAQEFKIGERTTTLLDETVLISGVSGGSILAAHYAAFGDATLKRFEPEFLLTPFESRLIRDVFWPGELYTLTSPWYGRTQLLMDRLNKLYEGKTFADARSRPGAPDLMITATDLTTGAPFNFTSEQFQLICSDLDATPLSFAVAASSAVPLLLSPVAIRNYADQCPDVKASVLQPASGYRAHILRRSAVSYRNAKERPYIHLVDGGVSDNLGVRLLLDQMTAVGSMGANFPEAKAGSIHRLVLVTVNSARALAERVDKSDQVPTIPQVLETLIFGAGTRDSQQTLAMLNDDLRRWRNEIQRTRGLPGSPFAADCEVYVVSVSLNDVDDDSFRYRLLRVPTAFTVEAQDVRDLQQAGSEAVRKSPAYQELVESLKALAPP